RGWPGAASQYRSLISMSEQTVMNDLTITHAQPVSADKQPASPGDLVSVENLAVNFTTSFGEVSALRGVSFSVKQGEVLGIVGESGSGKTVACRAILKLLAGNAKVAGGRILFEDQDVLGMDEAAL